MKLRVEKKYMFFWDSSYLKVFPIIFQEQVLFEILFVKINNFQNVGKSKGGGVGQCWKGFLLLLNLGTFRCFSPTRPSGPSWSSSRDVRLPMRFF